MGHPGKACGPRVDFAVTKMMQRGLKRFVMIGAAIGLMAGASARADTPKPAPSACPRGPVSIYFATGDVTPSPQTQAVLGKVSETAGDCAADRFDIVAHVDAAEGEHALALALDRLKLVADELVLLGLPASQIRVATDTPDPDRRASVGHRQIDIRFWKGEDAPAREDAGANRAPAIVAPPSNEI
jgi:hypothetical protein